MLPSEFLAKYKNQTCLIGGIITEAEALTSQNNNPYGRYTIEDYTGSTKIWLFGSAYQQFGHMMLKDLYVLVRGVVQQRNAGQRWFKEQPDETAEYEFIVQHVETLSDAQAQKVTGITIQTHLQNLSRELVEELHDQLSKSKGNARLTFVVYNSTNRQKVEMTSQTFAIKVTPKLYRWLCEKRQDGILSFTVQTNN